jgi:hypothetical protein
MAFMTCFSGLPAILLLGIGAAIRAPRAAPLVSLQSWRHPWCLTVAASPDAGHPALMRAGPHA